MYRSEGRHTGLVHAPNARALSEAIDDRVPERAFSEEHAVRVGQKIYRACLHRRREIVAAYKRHGDRFWRPNIQDVLHTLLLVVWDAAATSETWGIE